VYPFVWNLQVSANFQSVPGAPYTSTFNATNAAIQPSLGRTLSGGRTTTPIDLIRPFSQYEDRINQLDLRFGRTFHAQRLAIKASVDVYNALNASPVLAVITTYGARWLVPQDILDARLVKFGVEMSF